MQLYQLIWEQHLPSQNFIHLSSFFTVLLFYLAFFSLCTRAMNVIHNSASNKLQHLYIFYLKKSFSSSTDKRIHLPQNFNLKQNRIIFEVIFICFFFYFFFRREERSILIKILLFFSCSFSLQTGAHKLLADHRQNDFPHTQIYKDSLNKLKVDKKN